MYSELLDELPVVAEAAPFDLKERAQVFGEEMARTNTLRHAWAIYALIFGDDVTRSNIGLTDREVDLINQVSNVIAAVVSRKINEQSAQRGTGQAPFTRLITALQNL